MRVNNHESSKISHLLPSVAFGETIRKAAARAIAQQRVMGLPIAIGKDGRVVEILSNWLFPPV